MMLDSSTVTLIVIICSILLFIGGGFMIGLAKGDKTQKLLGWILIIIGLILIVTLLFILKMFG